MTTNEQLDITKLLHEAIDLELAADDAYELLIGPETRQQTVYLQLDLQLSRFADLAGWADVLQTGQPANHRQLTAQYVKVLALFLLFSAKRQWTHLVVLSAEQWQRIVGAKKQDQLAELNREYLAIKNLLNGAYVSRHQEDLRHAWHLLLKLGIVDFGISPAEITGAYQQLVTTANQQFNQH
ncbi:hypothetical protein [Limosilactobacillus antri]|uniref:hypothetical protein n=1 Tax=Limosilactobacillus antri TaxID=227943 RepID=UPI001F58A79C|nr:hypothetical protein [Limosilactobacillus antri]